MAIKGETKAKSARATQRSRGTLDGSAGVEFAGGKLTVTGEPAALLQTEYPGIDLRAVCDRAGPDMARFNYPNVDDAMTVLRKWARIASESKPPGKSTSTVTDEMRRIQAIVGANRS
ncbi:hypothetical protein APY04_0798 [Hyphomicrobium sulfonivorans]|uniref:Uncharacterized protein n=1 Tax=Hyphomicrobium sulfonivorans TaxID=121290 RepID=A0A120CXC4_HYPSL|nr:hypothetical protein APY04_0798 [Hyphomicrobium sulfonivorans]